MTIIDTPTNLKTYAKRLVAAGVTTAIRYESRLPNAGWKRWQPDEMKAFKEAGLYCGIVYEDNGRPSGEEIGYADASYSLMRCDARGQPDGSAIYYAVDYDATVSDVNNRIVPYFHGINRAHGEKGKPKQRIGCYGSGMVTRTLLALHLIDLRWITCSTGFNGSRDAIRNQEYELWQTHCDTHLMSIDVDLNSARVDDFGQFMPFAKSLKFPEPEPTPLAAETPSPQIAMAHGRGSWFSQFNGIHNWHDSGDAAGSNALGVPDYCQGISFYNGSTLGKWFEVHAPNGYVGIEQQTDVGPAPWTGRLIDISAVAAERMGYSPNTFPTNGEFYWRPVDPPAQVKDLSPRQQAIKWLLIRQKKEMTT